MFLCKLVLAFNAQELEFFHDRREIFCPRHIRGIISLVFQNASLNSPKEMGYSPESWSWSSIRRREFPLKPLTWREITPFNIWGRNLLFQTTEILTAKLYISPRRHKLGGFFKLHTLPAIMGETAHHTFSRLRKYRNDFSTRHLYKAVGETHGGQSSTLFNGPLKTAYFTLF